MAFWGWGNGNSGDSGFMLDSNALGFQLIDFADKSLGLFGVS
jgi:hypothetical protein